MRQDMSWLCLMEGVGSSFGYIGTLHIFILPDIDFLLLSEIDFQKTADGYVLSQPFLVPVGCVCLHLDKIIYYSRFDNQRNEKYSKRTIKTNFAIIFILIYQIQKYISPTFIICQIYQFISCSNILYQILHIQKYILFTLSFIHLTYHALGYYSLSPQQIYNYMIRTLLLNTLLLTLVLCAIDKDIITSVPGYPDVFKQRVWSGYLNTSSSSRKLFYVFIESSNNNGTNTPVTLWLNGGPGCSSLLGFLQQIGPFYLQQGARYKVGDKLTANPYSWHTLSHLLFIESPSGVGFSINIDPKFQYNDISTANDNLAAVQSFFAGFSQYAKNPFWIAGQSYAGKYIPDLAVLIDYTNNGGSGQMINLKGIMVGNGIMDFRNGDLQKSSIQFMIDHEFIDIDLIPYYRGSCLVDPESAGCRYFKFRFNENVDEINPYNVYSYCFYNDSFLQGENSRKRPLQGQASILRNIASNKGRYNSDDNSGMNGAPCAFFDGLLDYFTAHNKDYHALDGMKWNGPCAEDITGKYYINVEGSMKEYRYLLNKLADYHVVLYSGDWDDVVPYTDTMKNLQALYLVPSSTYLPFFANDQHAGWTQLYNGVTFAIIKGASHQVPQSKRAAAFQLFKNSLGVSSGKDVIRTG